jgi:hypothetical protein
MNLLVAGPEATPLTCNVNYSREPNMPLARFDLISRSAG